MLKIVITVLLFNLLLLAQTLQETFTQRGGEHNGLFLNPTYLLNSPSMQKRFNIKLLNSSFILDQKSFQFIQELEKAEGNQEISELLKKNIGKRLSISAHNFSSFHKITDPFSYSLGVGQSSNGLFIPHSGFGSSRAMESHIQNYKLLMGTAIFKKEHLRYGANLKWIEEAITHYNYSLSEMATEKSLWNYFENRHTKKRSQLAFDLGASYYFSQDLLNTQLSFALLNVGNTSSQKAGGLQQTTTIGLSFEPKKTHIKIDYFNKKLRADISKNIFNNTLTIHSGLIYNALSFGLNYKFSLFNVGFFSYKIENYQQHIERKNELSLEVTW